MPKLNWDNVLTNVLHLFELDVKLNVSVKADQAVTETRTTTFVSN